MGLQVDEVLSLCMQASHEKFGDDIQYEHLHTSYFTDDAYGLLEQNGKTNLLYFDLAGNQLQNCSILFAFPTDLLNAKELCERLILAGREFGHNEKY
ncbi:hypothetical protein ACFVS2_20760 [Brevibacillus sp. NPDC058079]|uniref:hypothetical protein n=1 Tax=Brevibacillus sp. NPDC058079 TaxID=3346330 RepID=UPI0036EFE526